MNRILMVLILNETTSNSTPFKHEDITKGRLQLETTRQMKNCINFIRRHEIYRVWDVDPCHITLPND